MQNTVVMSQLRSSVCPAVTGGNRKNTRIPLLFVTGA
jgi:hypothetical protein